MSYDLSKLRGRIIEKYGTLGAFSIDMGWSERTNGFKINGSIEWKQSEMIKASRLLDIKTSEIEQYFFKRKVQNVELI